MMQRHVSKKSSNKKKKTSKPKQNSPEHVITIEQTTPEITDDRSEDQPPHVLRAT
jgi:hypothetical protein